MTAEDVNAFEKLPTPSAVTTLDGTILQVNAALTRLVGKPEDELINTHLDDIASVASRIFMQTHAWPMLRKEKSVSELYIKIKDAHADSIPIMADCVVDEQGQAHRCYWVFYIAKERSKFEKELIAARQKVEKINNELAESRQALTTANKELERFVYNVSHDLRAPLVSINGFSAQLQKELSTHLTERQQHRFGRIATNIKKMQTLMDDLLKLSRITRQEIHFEPVNLNEIIKEQLSLIEKSLTDVDAKVRVESALPDVSSNPTLLSQCIGNLLTNAVAYREPERQLDISITAIANEDEIILNVSDNGIGIAQEDQERIFNMFEHLSPTQGTGVGLAIVKTAVKKIKGSISVSSELGKGSTFLLHLPMQRSN